ncbi:LolA family protein [Halorussus halobius]|uniref:LolA family protein n=1 Tax=Halorussus halobius TaxID=1710537 RepID=UPI001091C2AE|nr:hypothetical protein [Halorussus halobius]
MSPNSQTPPVAEMVERLVATDNLPDELHCIRTRTQEYAGGREETRFEIWERPPVAFRQVVLSAETVREPDFEVESAFTLGIESMGADVMIQNETGLAEYDSETNQYRKHEFEPPTDAGGHVTDPPFVGSAPEENFDVAYDGTDTVAGRETHVLTFRPTDDTEWVHRGFEYVTLWVDAEYWFPLAHETTYDVQEGGLLQVDADESLGDETYCQTTTFEEITFDAGIEDAKFRVPDDAERVD